MVDAEPEMPRHREVHALQQSHMEMSAGELSYFEKCGVLNKKDILSADARKPEIQYRAQLQNHGFQRISSKKNLILKQPKPKKE